MKLYITFGQEHAHRVNGIKVEPREDESPSPPTTDREERRDNWRADYAMRHRDWRADRVRDEG